MVGVEQYAFDVACQAGRQLLLDLTADSEAIEGRHPRQQIPVACVQRVDIGPSVEYCILRSPLCLNQGYDNSKLPL